VAASAPKTAINTASHLIQGRQNSKKSGFRGIRRWRDQALACVIRAGVCAWTQKEAEKETGNARASAKATRLFRMENLQNTNQISL